MQRMLITITVIALVFVAALVGALAAHWPFWQRAWQWQSAAGSWPAQLPGPTTVLRPATDAVTLRVVVDPRLAAQLAGSDTRLLLLGDSSGRVAAWFTPGMDERSVIDGRGLATGLLAPLYGSLTDERSSLLDRPLALFIPDWRADRRGHITPRQLLWQLSGFEAEVFVPLDPLSARAQLASGPDFARAALATKLAYPPGSHFEETPANAQLLAVVAGVVEQNTFATVLERRLWSQFAAAPATGLLDRRRGMLAAHCCLSAAAADWLRLGLLLANDGRSGERRILPAGFVAQIGVASPVHAGYGLGYRVELAPDGTGTLLILDTAGRQLAIAPRSGRALLWVGAGKAPSGLLSLLSPRGFPMQ